MDPRIRIVSLKRVPAEKFEYARVELGFENGETCTIVYGGGADRSKCRPVLKKFQIHFDKKGLEYFFAIWDKEAETIKLYGSTDASRWLDCVAQEPMDEIAHHMKNVTSEEVLEVWKKLAESTRIDILKR